MEIRDNEKWQELIETKDFDQLSNAERSFVLEQSTENNFRLERTVLLESKIAYQEVEPRALILEEEKKGIVIPLYQTILAIAAAFVLAFFLFRSTGSTIKINNNQTLATTDTIYVEKRIVDTIIQTKTEYIRLGEKEAQIVKVEVKCPQSNESSVLSNQSSFITDLSSATLANKGTSAANDETLGLMEEWGAPN